MTRCLVHPLCTSEKYNISLYSLPDEDGATAVEFPLCAFCIQTLRDNSHCKKEVLELAKETINLRYKTPIFSGHPFYRGGV